jgi:hypothetical protein
MFVTKRIILRNGSFVLLVLFLLLSTCQCMPQLQGPIRVENNNFRVQGSGQNSNTNQVPRDGISNGGQANLVGGFTPSNIGNKFVKSAGPKSGRWEGNYFINGDKETFYMDLDFFESGIIKGNGKLRNGNTFQVNGRFDQIRVTINAVYDKFDQVDTYIGEIDDGEIHGSRLGSHKKSNRDILNFYNEKDQSFFLHVTDNVARPIGRRQQQRPPLKNTSSNVETSKQGSKRIRFPAEQERPTPKSPRRPPGIIISAIPITTIFRDDVQGRTFILPSGNVNAGVLPLAENIEDQRLGFFPPLNDPKHAIKLQPK